MTDYSKMSDYEVNCQVAFHIGLRTVELAEEGTFDPCNNQADAWPIIVKHGISLTYHQSRNEWSAVFNSENISMNGSPLRAAMIVFLMMKDAEK